MVWPRACCPLCVSSEREEVFSHYVCQLSSGSRQIRTRARAAMSRVTMSCLWTPVFAPSASPCVVRVCWAGGGSKPWARICAGWGGSTLPRCAPHRRHWRKDPCGQEVTTRVGDGSGPRAGGVIPEQGPSPVEIKGALGGRSGRLLDVLGTSLRGDSGVECGCRDACVVRCARLSQRDAIGAVGPLSFLCVSRVGNSRGSALDTDSRAIALGRNCARRWSPEALDDASFSRLGAFAIKPSVIGLGSVDRFGTSSIGRTGEPEQECMEQSLEPVS